MTKLDAFLSEKGKRIQWPAKGILQQSADAKEKSINATIGIALDEKGGPMHLSAMESVIAPKEAFPYAPGFGVMALRKTWKKELAKKNPSLTCSHTLPVVTVGLTHALNITGSLFVDSGDPIILPELFWGNYKLIFEHSYGAKLVTYPFFEKEGFNLAAFTEALTCRKKALVLLNFPNNPSGYTPREEEIEKIIAVLHAAAERGSKLIVVLDDAYFGLVYEEGVARESLFSRIAELHENILAVKIDGATKEEFAWGFRIGFLTYGGKGLSEEELQLLESKSAATIRASVSNCNHLGQSMLLHALQDPKHEEEKKEKFKILKERYEKVKEVLEQNESYKDSFTPLPYNSGYFMCIKLNENLNAEAVRQKLLKEYDTGVIALPGNLLRIAYSGVPEEKIPKLFENIKQACE